MIGFPIDPIVQKTLNERKQVLKRNKNPYAPTDGKNPNKEIQKNLVRTPYISMFSSPKLISPTGDTNNQLDEGDIILSNQEYNRSDETENFNPINYGFDLYSDVQTQGGKFKYQPDKREDGTQRYQSQFKAQPGIISLTSEYQSTSNVYFTREVSITWRCHHLDDLERLSYRFLTLNKLVYVEWGWNYADKPATTFITPENLKRINNPTTLREDVLKYGKGNFDAVLGLIKNFEWSSTGGGFECRTDIISQGVDIFNQRINDDTQFVSRGNDFNKPDIPEYLSIEEYDRISEKYNITQNSQGGLGTDTVVLDSDTYIRNINLRDKSDNVTAIADNTRVDPTAAQTRFAISEEQRRQEQLFTYAIDNLDIIINEQIYKTPSAQKSVLNKTIKANIAESGALLSEQKQKFQALYDKILAEVTKEYDTGDFTNWNEGSQYDQEGIERNKDKAINIETNKRFQEQNSGKTLEQKKKQLEKAYNENLVQRPVEIKSNIFFNKNFVQKIDEQKLPKYFKTIEVDEIEYDFDLKEEIKPPEYNSQQTWVRWGWFEDNILNRYFGRVTQDGTPIVKIRSVRNEKNNPVQEKIINHKEFLTPDINRFIFPGKFKLGLNSEAEKERRNDRIKKYESLFQEDVEYEFAKVFFDFDVDTAREVRGALEINPDITLEQLQDIIDTEDKFVPNLDDLKRKSEKLKFLKILEEVMRPGSAEKIFTDLGETELAELEIPQFDSENENEGILRNVFINVNHLQEIFREKTTLGVCINRLLESFNATTPLFNLIPVVNVKENEGHILFTEQRFTEGFKPESQLQYEFPIKITESFVKSTNLASDITNEGTKILLSQQFANAPEPVIDKKTGASIPAQVKWDKLNRVGNKYIFNKNLENGIEPFLYTNYASPLEVGVVSQDYGQKQGDYKKPLAFGDGASLSLSSMSVYNLEKIKLRNEQNNNKVNEKSTETSDKVKYAIEFPGNYSENGILKARKELQNTENLQGTRFGQSPYAEFGLLFLTNTMSIDGIAGITPGSIYTSNYLPDKFRDNAYFFTQNASQTVDSSTWTTEITGRVLFKYKTESGVVGADSVLEARKQFEKNNSSRLDKTDSLSDNPELLNLGQVQND